MGWAGVGGCCKKLTVQKPKGEQLSFPERPTVYEDALGEPSGQRGVATSHPVTATRATKVEKWT